MDKARIKRGVKWALIALVVAVALIHIVHALTLDRIIQYKEVPFFSESFPAQLSGYTVAFITDTHALPHNRLMRVVERLNERQVDLLLLGGDFEQHGEELLQTMALFSQIATTDGIFGVDGNHDRYAELFAAFEQHGIVPLSNSGLHIHEGFYLAGVEDLWRRSPDIAQATSGALPDDFVLLVSHNPDVTMRQYTGNVDLILSGHTHGGNVTFFGLWAPALTHTRIATHYGQRFMSGWAQSRDGVPVFVSNGTGQYFMRVFARPQVILLTLHSQQGENA